MSQSPPPRFQPREHYGMTIGELATALITGLLIVTFIVAGVWYIRKAFAVQVKPLPSVEASWPTLGDMK